MFHSIVVTVLALTGNPGAPADVHLNLRGRTVGILEQVARGPGCRSCTLTRVGGIAQNTNETPPPPPPLLNADPNTDQTPPPETGSDVPDYNTPPPPPDNAPHAQLEPQGDLSGGTFNGMEALVGGLTLFGADVVAAGVLVGVLIATVGVGLSSSSSANSSAFVGGIIVFFGGLILHALLSPLYCALAEKWVAKEPTNKGLMGAILGAYASAFTLGAIVIGLQVVAGALFGGNYTGTNAAYGTFSGLITLIGIVGRYVGVPIATSYAMHYGPGPTTQPQGYASADPRPLRWLPRVTAEGREEIPLSAPTAFAW